MATHRLENYLRRHRKQSGLTQRDVAFLLGCQSGAKVSRYEQRRRKPSLEAALASEAIFGTPTKDLFAGMYDRARITVQKRAKQLLKKLESAEDDPDVRAKRSLLQAIVNPSSEEPRYEPIPNQ